ncbi:MAG: tetratricopeptide repeat protein [Candidatus Hydrogenedentes bacterium]|nr:tetratricopeptide repeat protein [Candidatus Hydrogenedentota bacterium]
MSNYVRLALTSMLFALLACAAFAGAHSGDGKGATNVPLYTNLGNHHHEVTAASPKAQAFFDQGLRLIYGFNHDEAILAFKEALKYDPNCAMAYWGIAAAKGPNYNAAMDAEATKASYEASRRALELAPNATQPERDYIAAMAVRYTDKPDAVRADLDKAYSDAMRDLAKKYPDDDDAQTLFAESLMNLRPWQLWAKDGTPSDVTPEVLQTLEKVLARNSKHIGAIHYYIHSTEASPNPEKAEPYADRLGKLIPGAGHMVHMPAHVYIRTGRYDDGVKVNIKAADLDREFVNWRKPGPMYRMYFTHNIHFIWSCASIGGRSKASLSAARDLVNEMPLELLVAMPPLEFQAPSPYFALVRFGKWTQMLEEPRPATELQYTTGMWNYGRGMAFANLKQFDSARAEAAQLTAVRDAMPDDRMVNLNKAKDVLTIASVVLNAEIARTEGKLPEAIEGFKKALPLEDALNYEEPPSWHLPVRLYLGAALLDAGMPAEAEAAYREDLKHYPKNGWALYGLAQSLQKQGKNAEARATQKQFKKAWKRADVKLTSSRF